jgi:hypothetical protein
VNEVREAGLPGSVRRGTRRGAPLWAPLAAGLAAIAAPGAVRADAAPGCVAAPGLDDTAQAAAICAALDRALGEVGGQLAVRLAGLSPQQVLLVLTDPRDPAAPPVELRVGVTDTDLAPPLHGQIADTVLAAARTLGLLPTD